MEGNDGSKILLIVTSMQFAGRCISWSLEDAKLRDAKLYITSCVPKPNELKDDIRIWEKEDGPEDVHAQLKKTLASLDAENVELLRPIGSSAAFNKITAIISKYGITRVHYLVSAQLATTSPQLNLGQRLLNEVDCSVTLFDPGITSGPTNSQRIIIPLDLAMSSYAVRDSITAISEHDIIILLHISADFGEDSAKIAERELNIKMQDMGITEENVRIKPMTILADGLFQGVVNFIKPGDVVVLGGMSTKAFHQFKHLFISDRPQDFDKIPIAITRPVELGSRGVTQRKFRQLKALMPDLSLNDRVSLYDRIQAGARLTTDYVFMISLSVLIATSGLLADNTAVVIGAMLVAPLMTPIIGMGLALAQGNLALLKRSSIATGAGLLIGAILSFLLSLFIPLDELPLEVLSRGAPDLVDLLIAAFSGMAAAYALSRASVAEAIVGVAVAAALVPPLACVGIGVSYGNYILAKGASILLATNVAAIILGAAFVFRQLGVPGTRFRSKLSFRIRWVSFALVISILLLTVPLGYQMADRLTVGQMRPMAFRVSRSVANAIDEVLDQHEGIDVLMIGRSGSGQSRTIRILLVSDQQVDASVIKKLREAIHSVQRKETQVEIGVFSNDVTTSPEVNNSP